MAFETAGHLRAHESRVHTESRFTCAECSQHHENPSSTADGNSVSHAVSFPSYALLQAHIRSVHPPQCPNCSLTCSTSRELRRHLEVAHGDVSLEERKVFSCSVPGCDRSFTKKGNLTVHIRTVHEGEKRFACGETDLSSSKKVPGWTTGQGQGCGKRYGSKLALEEHIRTTHLGYQNAKAERRQRLGHSKPSTSTKSSNTPSTLATLTGHGYAEETGRHIACFIDSCPHRFHRDYDLWVHMSGKHECSEDHIRDMFMQRALLADGDQPSSGILGIYGLEFDNDNPSYDPFDMSPTGGTPHPQNAAVKADADNYGLDALAGGESELGTGADVTMHGDVHSKIPNYDDDMALIDPVLAYNLMDE